MAVGTEVVARKYLDVIAGTPVSVDIPVFRVDDIKVYYGFQAFLAVYNIDYNLVIGGDFQTCTVTPLQPLVDKIASLIASNSENTNHIVVTRELDYLTETTPSGVRYTPFTSREFDRTVMRFQQLNYSAGRSLRRKGQDPDAGVWDAKNARITGVADGVDFGDAVNVGQMEALNPDEMWLTHFKGYRTDDPVSASESDFYKNTVTNAWMVYRGGTWVGALPGGVLLSINSEAPDAAGNIDIAVASQVKTPFDYGARTTDAEGKDQYAPLQAMFDAVATSYDESLGGFRLSADLTGRAWVTETSLNVTNITQPGMLIQNGTIVGRCAGKIVLDLLGSNTVTIKDITIYGDKTLTPAIGLAYGRSVDSFLCPNFKISNLTTNGYFSQTAVLNYASEVSSELSCRYFNQHRSLTAYCEVCVDNVRTLNDHIGSVSSDYTSLANARANYSNINHYKSQMQQQRRSDYHMPIININQGNPATVTVASSDLVAANVSSGDEVFLEGIGGMTELDDTTFSITNVDLASGTFELSGVDSTAYGAFTQGYLRNRTGPALLLAGAMSVTSQASYTLTYGSPAIVIDALNGVACRALDMDLQAESNVDKPIRMYLPDSGTHIVQGMRLRLTQYGQQMKTSVFELLNAGHVRFDGLELSVVNMSVAPTLGAFDNPSQVLLYNSHITMALHEGLGAVEDYLVFNGVTTAYDRFPRTIDYTEPTVAGSLSGAGVGPYHNNLRESNSPANNDYLGSYRFQGFDTSGSLVNYAQLRGKISNATSGAGVLEFAASEAGVARILAQFAPVAGHQTTSLIVRLNISGTDYVKRVLLGPADSAGTGYRTLRVNN